MDEDRELPPDPEAKEEAIDLERVPSRSLRLGGRSISANVGLGTLLVLELETRCVGVDRLDEYSLCAMSRCHPMLS